MNMSIGGAGGGMSFGTSLTAKNAYSKNAGIQSIQHTSRGKKKTKQLNYNSREISDQLLRASKSRGALEVLSRAKRKVGLLQRCLVTGEYNDREVRAAIAHARRIVRCAQMKVRNLKEEEELKRKHEKRNDGDKVKRENEVKRRVNRKKMNLKAEAALDDVKKAQEEKAKQLELQRRRRIHRNAEREKINEADMKYIKERYENASGISSVNYSEVIVELSASAVQMNELYMSEKAEREIQQEAEQEVDMEMGSENITGECTPGAGSAFEGVQADAGISDEGSVS